MKKRLISLALALMLVLTFLSVPAFAADVEYTNETDGILMTPVTVSESAGTVTVSMSAKKAEGDAENLMFVVSRYNQKKLVDVEIQTQSVGTAETDFSVTLTGVSGTYEINAALVSPTDSFMPKGTPASYPAQDGAEELRGLKVNGEDVFESLNEVSECTVLIPASTADYSGIEVMPYTMDSSSTVAIENGTGTFPDKQTLTVTATNGKTKAYTILYEYDMHVIVGATNISDFSDNETFDTKEATTGDVKFAYSGLGTDGLVRTNFHAWEGTLGEYNSLTQSYTYTGSPVYTNSTLGTWVVYEIWDKSLEGSDYIPFNSHNLATFGEVKYDGTNTVSGNSDTSKDLADGTTLLTFTLDAPATVSILTTTEIADFVDKDGYTYSAGGISAAQGGINSNFTGMLDRRFGCRYSKGYAAGDTVTIPYRKALAKSRTPLVLISPRADAAVDPGGSGGGTTDPTPGPTPDPEPTSLITDYTKIVQSMTYEAYCTYAGEAFIEDKRETATTLININFIQDKDFTVGSLAGPNEQRTVQSISSDYSWLEGLEYIRFDNGYTYSENGRESRDWIVEAYSGVSTPSGSYGFSKIVPWVSFKVGEAADVIIAATGESAFLEEKGWTKTVISDGFAFDTIRTNGEVDKYRVIYEKRFAANETVEIYNLLTGYQKQIYFVSPLTTE